MSNTEKAAHIIERTVLGKQTTAPSTALAITEALADAGLLMPDLPEPDNDEYGTAWGQVFNYQEEPDWRDTKGYVAANAGAVEVVGNDTHIHTPGEARRLAYALLAAANHAEKENRA